VVGVQNIIIWAAKCKKRVRVSGYRHSWSSLFSDDDQILICTLSLRKSNVIPAFSQINEPTLDPDNELECIELVGDEFVDQEDGKTKRLCRIGCATTSEMFRKHIVKNSSSSTSYFDYTVPINIIMVEITFGGSNAPICHGAGLRHKTLSDLVVAIEFVDANGKLRKVSDPILIKAAAGCFGLLGMITHIVMKLDKLTYAELNPQMVDLSLTIPPSAAQMKNFPKQLTKLLNSNGYKTPQQLQSAWEKFTSDAENKYYSEWFWFPYQSKCWVNVWDNTTDKTGAVDYPGDTVAFIQELEDWAGQISSNSVLKALPPSWQGRVLGIL
jgi:hypothetical protein